MITGRGGSGGWAPVVRRWGIAVAVVLLTVLATAVPAWAQEGGGDPAKAGDLTGNFDVVVYLLIPLAIVLAVVLAIVLGPLGEPPARTKRTGRVSQALQDRDASDDHQPTS
jgi:hypothetical protein